MTTEEAASTDMCCASCGIAEVDDVKLKKCDACDLVGYCGDKCQREHLSQHDPSCKKRAAELREEILFKQPESSHLGDCLICFLPLQINKKHVMLECCCKIICEGCAGLLLGYASTERIFNSSNHSDGSPQNAGRNRQE